MGQGILAVLWGFFVSQIQGARSKSLYAIIFLFLIVINSLVIPELEVTQA